MYTLCSSARVHEGARSLIENRGGAREDAAQSLSVRFCIVPEQALLLSPAFLFSLLPLYQTSFRSKWPCLWWLWASSIWVCGLSSSFSRIQTNQTSTLIWSKPKHNHLEPVTDEWERGGALISDISHLAKCRVLMSSAYYQNKIDISTYMKETQPAWTLTSEIWENFLLFLAFYFSLPSMSCSEKDVQISIVWVHLLGLLMGQMLVKYNVK